MDDSPIDYCNCANGKFLLDGKRTCVYCNKSMRPPNRQQRREQARAHRRFQKVAAKRRAA